MNKLQPLYIDEAMLEKHGACAYSRKIFRRTFGRGARVEVTRQNFLKAVKAGMDAYWLPDRYASHLGVNNDAEMGAIYNTESNVPHGYYVEDGGCRGCAADERLRAPLFWKEIQRLRRIAAKQQKAVRA